MLDQDYEAGDDFNLRDYAWDFIPCEPHPKQHLCMMLSGVREILYGGAAGGGKSQWLAMEALRDVGHADYSAMLFRKTLTDLKLPGGLIPRLKDWLGSRKEVRWNGQDNCFTFPSGATVSFGYAKNDDEIERYKGAELNFLGWDELTEHTEKRYTYMFSRMRRKVTSRVPLRIRSATNPGGPGHEFVMKRFILHQQKIERGELPPFAEDRLYIPATIKDNPSLSEEEYRKSLQNVSVMRRRQLESGDWTAIDRGEVFDLAWFFKRFLTTALPTRLRIVRAFDLAATTPTEKSPDPDWSATVLLAESDGLFFILHVDRMRGLPVEVQRWMTDWAQHDAVVFGRSIPVLVEQDPGSAGLYQMADLQRILAGCMVQGIPTHGQTKRARAEAFSSYASNGWVWSAPGRFGYDSTWGFQDSEFWREVHAFNGKKKRQHVDGSGDAIHDDMVDALVTAWRGLTLLGGDPVKVHWGSSSVVDTQGMIPPTNEFLGAFLEDNPDLNPMPSTEPFHMRKAPQPPTFIPAEEEVPTKGKGATKVRRAKRPPVFDWET